MFGSLLIEFAHAKKLNKSNQKLVQIKKPSQRTVFVQLITCSECRLVKQKLLPGAKVRKYGRMPPKELPIIGAENKNPCFST